MSQIESKRLVTNATTVALPATIHGRKRTMNALLTIALVVIAVAQFSKAEWPSGAALTVAALISAFRFWRLRDAVHVRLQDGVLHSYDPHTGGFKTMPVAEIASIQFRAGSDRNLVKLPDRFIVRSNRIERELEVFVLADEQKSKLDAFFKTHFPEQLQEPVTPLSGFPPARE